MYMCVISMFALKLHDLCVKVIDKQMKPLYSMCTRIVNDVTWCHKQELQRHGVDQTHDVMNTELDASVMRMVLTRID